MKHFTRLLTIFLTLSVIGKSQAQTDIPGFTYGGTFEGHTYYLSECLSTWENADAVAREMGGYLATVTSEGEHDFVTALAPDIYVDEYYYYYLEGGAWIGLISYSLPPWFSGVCNYWAWWNGEDLVYQNWAQDPFPEPTNSNCGFAAVAGQCFSAYCNENTDGWRTAFYRDVYKVYIVEFDEQWNCNDDHNKAYVCHNGNTLCVQNGSLQNHLDHGDFFGPCTGCNSELRSFTQQTEVASGTEKIHAAAEDDHGHRSISANTEEPTVYPNPTTDDFHIQLPAAISKGIVCISTPSGQEIKFIEFNQSGALSLSVSDYPSGLYLIELRSENDYWQLKLVKQ